MTDDLPPALAAKIEAIDGELEISKQEMLILSASITNLNRRRAALLEAAELCRAAWWSRTWPTCAPRCRW